MVPRHITGEIIMLTQGFQNTLMVKTGFCDQGSAMNKNVGCKGLGNSFTSILGSLISEAESGKAIGTKNLMSLMNIEQGAGKKTDGVIALLASVITEQNGVIPADGFVGAEGLDALKNLLEQMGFDKEAVKDFIAREKEGEGENDLSLQALLSDLGQFLKDNDQGLTLDISALPYIQTALNESGLEPDQIENIVGNSVDKSEGVDVGALLSELKPYINNGTGDAEQKQLKSGEQAEAGKGKLSLSEFAEKLEAATAGNQTSGEQQALADRFARAFGDSIHGNNKKVVKDGAESHSVTETIDPKNPALRFDTENSLGLQNNKNTTTDSGDQAQALAAGGEKKNLQESDLAALKNIHDAKLSKDSAVTGKGNEDSASFSMKNIAGSGVYGKTSEVNTVSATEKNLPAYVTDQVARQISRAVKNGDSEIKFHIKPPDMGRVELSIQTTANGLRINVIAEQGTTRDMILNHASELKNLLAEQGIRLEKMDVNLSGDFGQGMAQARQESDHSGRGRRNKDKPVFSMDPISGELKDNTMTTFFPTGQQSRGRLDLVA